MVTEMNKTMKKILIRIGAVILALIFSGIAVYNEGLATTFLAIAMVFAVSPYILGGFDVDLVWPDKK
jgi:hypothetical protein